MTDRSFSFDSLHARYGASLPRKHADLAAAGVAFAAAPGEAGLRRELQHQVHRLAGSASAYGYDALGEQARMLNTLLVDWENAGASLRSTPADLAAEVESLLQTLLAMLEAAGRSARASPKVHAGNARLRVILVEDDPDQSALIARQLATLGCEVRVASHSATLWELLATWPCDAAVLDFWLRGETAVEIAAMLRRESSFAGIALICYSVEQNPLRLAGALDAGCDAALSKADGAERLVALLRECVDAHRGP